MGILTPKSLVEQPAPEKLSDFKKLAAAPDQYAIPEIAQKRVPTDRFYLAIFIIFNIVLFMFLTYCFLQCDELREKNGYDPCGNVCGENNVAVEGLKCSGQDYSKSPFLRYDRPLSDGIVEPEELYLLDRKCVHKCKKSDIKSMNRCFPTLSEENNTTANDYEYDDDVMYRDVVLDTTKSVVINDGTKLEKIFKNLGYLGLSIVIAIGSILLILVALRYSTAAVVWSSTVFSYLILVIVTLFTWFSSSNDDYQHSVATVWTILTILVTLVLIRHFKRIPLVIAIMNEALKAVFTMPGLFLHSFLAFLSYFLAGFFFLLTLVQLSHAGVLTKFMEDYYIYDSNAGIIFTLFLAFLMFIWIYEFIDGCHNMVISGSVSTWYFSRDKTFLGSPVKDSFMNLMKYHLGSVAFGSMILTAIALLRALLHSLANRRTQWLVRCCMGPIERLLEYLCKNAYVQVAMHGEPFVKSGKRAAQLLYWNLKEVVALNFVQFMVLFLLNLAVCLFTILIMIFLNDSESKEYVTVVTLGGILAFLMARAVFGTIKIAIATIFLCYCEDIAINDGLDRPYYMTTELMLFFDETKLVLGGDVNVNKPEECQEV